MYQLPDRPGVSIADEFSSVVGQEGGGYGINTLLGLAMNFGTVIAGIILVFLLVGGGLKIIQGAGSGDAKSSAQGRQAITWAIGGFLVVLFAYWGIRLIEVIVGVDFTTNPLSPAS